jgi:hypothetical protein
MTQRTHLYAGGGGKVFVEAEALGKEAFRNQDWQLRTELKCLGV